MGLFKFGAGENNYCSACGQSNENCNCIYESNTKMNHQNICTTCKEMSYNCTCDETCYECENCGCISFVQKGPCKECKLSSPVRKIVSRETQENSKTEKSYVQDEILKSTLP